MLMQLYPVAKVEEKLPEWAWSHLCGFKEEIVKHCFQNGVTESYKAGVQIKTEGNGKQKKISGYQEAQEKKTTWYIHITHMWCKWPWIYHAAD